MLLLSPAVKFGDNRQIAYVQWCGMILSEHTAMLDQNFVMPLPPKLLQ
jgi:hypothetical protein